MNIFKYEVLPGSNRINLPKSSKILSTGAQGNSIFVWALTSDSVETEPREVFITGTGHEISEGLINQLDFLGTVFQNEFVWHVFQRP